MSRTLLAWLLLAPALAAAQIYRWTDAQGRVHFSNQTPPPGVNAVVVDPHAREVAPTPPPQSGPGCYTLACERERLEERERRRAEAERREAEERAARAAREPRAPRGLSFAKYISIQRGMTEGELLALAGEPDLVSDQGIAIAAPSTVATGRRQAGAARAGLTLKTWTYLPTVADPFVTTITLVGGRVSEIERVRKF
ncbi:MAG: DUF4124 domain-containing protein [Burkholderiales bacterium]|nr:DUF4124 domain-containing protein [Burkholderiales bacterium]